MAPLMKDTITDPDSRTILTKPIKSGVIKHNPSLCRGCGICELACSLYHEKVCSPLLSRIYIMRDTIDLNWSANVCFQCDYPGCYFVCPVQAIKIDPKTGSRYINQSLCTGCGICVKACPLMPKERIISFQTVKSEKSNRLFIKCDLCKDREKGPICVEYCPRNALSYTPPNQR